MSPRDFLELHLRWYNEDRERLARRGGLPNLDQRLRDLEVKIQRVEHLLSELPAADPSHCQLANLQPLR